MCGFLFGFDFLEDIGHLRFDLLVENGGQFFSKWLCSPEVGGESGVDGTCGEEFFLSFETLLHWHVVGYVFLAAVFDSHVAVPQWNFHVFQDVSSVIAAIHYVDLGQAADRSLAWRIDFSHYLQCLADSEVLISGYDAEDDGARFRDIPKCHIFGDIVDVRGLSADGDGGDSGQVDDGEVGARFGEDIEDDGLVDNLLILAADLVGHLVDARPHLVEVGESLLHALLQNFVELGVGGGERGHIIHTQLEGSPRDHTLNSFGNTDPLGRKSRPTICSRSELLPEDWVPRTMTLGRESWLPRPISLRRSTMEITLRRSLARMLPYIYQINIKIWEFAINQLIHNKITSMKIL